MLCNIKYLQAPGFGTFLSNTLEFNENEFLIAQNQLQQTTERTYGSSEMTNTYYAAPTLKSLVSQKAQQGQQL